MPTSSTETVDNAPLGHLISAVVNRLNPLAPSRAPQTPVGPLEYRATERRADELTERDLGVTVSARNGDHWMIRSLRRIIQDGELLIQIDTNEGQLRRRPYEAVYTWAWETPHQPVVHSSPADMAIRRAHQEHWDREMAAWRVEEAARLAEKAAKKAAGEAELREYRARLAANPGRLIQGSNWSGDLRR